MSVTFTAEELAALQTGLRMLKVWHQKSAAAWRKAAGAQSASAEYHDRHAAFVADLATRLNNL